MKTKLYPFKFTPIYQYRLWGGRRLKKWLSIPLPKNEPIGEAWLLSDREDHTSTVANGELKGYTITKLITEFSNEIMGKIGAEFKRFPLLLKYLDCNEILSVQVHPGDDQKEYIPKGNTGKSEAWVVLETSAHACIYAGLKPNTTKEDLEKAVHKKSLASQMHSFIPKKDDAIYIKSGTVHTLGGAVVFEVQQNSDVTFRLYDWDRKDPKTGTPRKLQVDQAMACIDFNQININPIIPIPTNDPDVEKLFDNPHFTTWQIKKNSTFEAGLENQPTILVCLEGEASTSHNAQSYPIAKGEVMLIPAILGSLQFETKSEIKLLQIAIPTHRPNSQNHEQT